jgi:hypothetical protein
MNMNEAGVNEKIYPDLLSVWQEAVSQPNLDFDDIAAYFVAFCNHCFAWNAERMIRLDEVLRVISKNDEKNMLERIYRGLCEGSKGIESYGRARDIFLDANKLRPNVRVVNLYLFLLTLMESAVRNKDENLWREGYEYYDRLSPEYQKYALGNHGKRENCESLFFPHFPKESDEASQYRSIISCFACFVEYYGKAQREPFKDRYDLRMTALFRNPLIQFFEWCTQVWANEDLHPEDNSYFTEIFGEMELLFYGLLDNLMDELESEDAAVKRGLLQPSMDVSYLFGGPDIQRMAMLHREVTREIRYEGFEYEVQSEAAVRKTRNRRQKLGLPYKSYAFNIRSFNFSMEPNSYAEKRKLEKANQEKDAIMRDFAHTYGNMKATSLRNIGQTLLLHKDAELKRLGRQVLYEYGIKQDLTQDISLMRLRHANDAEEMRRLMQSGIARATEPDDENEIIGIGEILDTALQRCMLRIFYDTTDMKSKLAKSRLKTFAGSVSALRDSFEKNVLTDAANAVEWLTGQGFPLCLSSDADWNEVVLWKDSHSAAFLRDLLSELFFNALKYAEFTHPIVFGLAAESGATGDGVKKWLCIHIENIRTAESLDYTGDGLTAKSGVLDMLNGNSDFAPGSHLRMSPPENALFCVDIRVDKSMFVEER